jgi:hypothetical protein
MTYPRLDTLRSNLKTLNPMHPGYEEGVYNLLIAMVADKVINDAAAFMNRDVEEIPEALDSTILLKAASWLSDSGVLKTVDEQSAGGPVSSIAEGDTTVSFAVTADPITALNGANFLDDDFKRTLRRYRKVAEPWGTD